MEIKIITSLIVLYFLIVIVITNKVINRIIKARMVTLHEATNLHDIFNAPFIKKLLKSSYESYEKLLAEVDENSTLIKESFEKHVQKKIDTINKYSKLLIIGKVFIVISVLFLISKYVLIAYIATKKDISFHPTFYLEFEILSLVAIMFYGKSILKQLIGYLRYLIDRVNGL